MGRAVDLAFGIIALLVDAQAVAVLAVGRPGHHPAAIGERGDSRVILIARRVCVDLGLDALSAAVGIVGLLVDAIAATILWSGHPGHHPAAIGERADSRVSLIDRRVCV